MSSSVSISVNADENTTGPPYSIMTGIICDTLPQLMGNGYFKSIGAEMLKGGNASRVYLEIESR